MKTYTSVFGATKGILTNEGWRAFFKGLTPSLVQVAPQTGVSFASYSLLSNIWLNTISDHSKLEVLKQYLLTKTVFTGGICCIENFELQRKMFAFFSLKVF